MWLLVISKISMRNDTRVILKCWCQPMDQRYSINFVAAALDYVFRCQTLHFISSSSMWLVISQQCHCTVPEKNETLGNVTLVQIFECKQRKDGSFVFIYVQSLLLAQQTSKKCQGCFVGTDYKYTADNRIWIWSLTIVVQSILLFRQEDNEHPVLFPFNQPHIGNVIHIFFPISATYWQYIQWTSIGNYSSLSQPYSDSSYTMDIYEPILPYFSHIVTVHTMDIYEPILPYFSHTVTVAYIHWTYMTPYSSLWRSCPGITYSGEIERCLSS